MVPYSWLVMKEIWDLIQSTNKSVKNLVAFKYMLKPMKLAQVLILLVSPYNR